MHEMSLAEGIRQIIDDQARVQGFGRVLRLRLEIGRFAGVENPRWNSRWMWCCAAVPPKVRRWTCWTCPGARCAMIAGRP